MHRPARRSELCKEQGLVAGEASRASMGKQYNLYSWVSIRNVLKKYERIKKPVLRRASYRNCVLLDGNKRPNHHSNDPAVAVNLHHWIDSIKRFQEFLSCILYEHLKSSLIAIYKLRND